MIEIRIIGEDHKADIRIPNEPFALFGRIIPSFDGERWDYRLVRFAPGNVSEMCFPDENYDYDSMKDSIFIGAYDGETCVGLVLIQPAFFRYMHVSDLKVNGKYRRRRVGRRLIEKANEVAAAHGFRGLYLECQDNNPGAFLFYLDSGFYIGGLDTNVYRHTNQEGKANILLYSECDSTDSGF